MLKFLFYFLAFFFLIRFVMRVVLPMVGGVRQVKAKMREMQEQINKAQQSSAQAQPPKQEPRKGDYIEYEEVK